MGERSHLALHARIRQRQVCLHALGYAVQPQFWFDTEQTIIIIIIIITVTSGTIVAF